MRSAKGLKASCIPAGPAERSASPSADAEKDIPADRLKKFASFGGTARMDTQA